ncbi:MAG: phosphomannomutase/phosphoglucomutase [Gammaproteobacteria bacterium]|nr:phosphomannomutase/phosphoglucomutase [Gammaproteobacteria bacterium]
MLSEKTKIDHSIFRAYDIRGVVGETLTVDAVYALGKAIGSLTLENGEKTLIVGRDGRLSGPSLVKALCEGVLTTGCDVVDLGMVPTPLLYYATHVLESRSGVMLTGSHNPANYNGLKIVINGKALAETEIQNLRKRILSETYLKGKGKWREFEIAEIYIQNVCKNVTLKKPLKIVVDCANSVPAMIAPALFRQLGCEVYPLYCEVDGNFPNHHPDPSQVENLKDLIQKVQEVDADLGLAFDGDGDRLGVVTKKGAIIWPDRQMMLFAKAILEEHPGAKIIYDVKCTNHLATVIKAHGGEPIMWKTGHSLIKSKLVESGALLAGEMSGHIFIKDRWFGFDDAIYAGARFLEILSAESKTIDELFEAIPDSVNTPELKVYVADDEKFGLMERLIASANFHDAEDINTIDGLRVNYSDGWGLVRLSNTTPCLVLRFEAESEKVLAKIQMIFREFLLASEPSLDLPF